ncbi:MAG: prolipoprotein diacylglyceryl transferase [Clostridiales bacterium]|nr:prolipoprotein diacylglyceryl transferase [Clostridiales bacterium]
MYEISFPGLGIDGFTIHSVAFTVFGKDIMWYGILICFGMILAYLYAHSRAKFEGIKTDDLLDLGFFVILFGIVGARLYYVLFAPTSYIAKGGSLLENIWNTIVNVVSIWNGGLAIFGGILAGFATAIFVAKKKKIRLPVLLDVLSPSVMIGQIVGRWGNFMNAEAYGSETTVPWRMGIKRISAGGLYTQSIEVHPTFLYESLWNLIGFTLIAIFYKKKKFNGQVFYFYMIWYGLGRAVIEGLRSDSLYIAGNEHLRVSQILAALVCIAGIILMIRGYAKLKKAAGIDGTSENVQAIGAAYITEPSAQNSLPESEAESEESNIPEGETKDGSEDH